MAGQIVEQVHDITREVRIAGQQPRIGLQAGSLYVVIARIASVLGAVVPIYHLDGITQDLRFTPEALAEICLGKIRRWNDPEIQRSSRGVALPDAAIAVVHRSDGSGIPWVWSDFLSKVSPAWSAQVGRGTTLNWPVGSGADRNEGVAETVGRTSNSIGYVELAYAIQR